MQIKNILIVANKTHYERFIVDEKNDHYLKLLKKRDISVAKWKQNYHEHQKSVEAVITGLTLLGIPHTKIWRKQVHRPYGNIKSYDMVISIGGDGTFLQTAQWINPTQIILGINAVPSVSTGALCAGHAENFLPLMLDLLAGKIKPKRIPRLQIVVDNKKIPYLALNEALFANFCPAATARYVLKLGGKIEAQKSSGVWIASGTGSSGAIKSAGGKTMLRSDGRLQYLVREPFLEKVGRHFLLKGTLKLKQKMILISKMETGCIFLDGTHYSKRIPYGAKVTFIGNASPLNALL